VWPAVVRVHVQVPASPGVAPDYRPAQHDEEQCDEQVGGGRETRRQVQAARDDEERHGPEARGVPEGPGEPQPAGVPEAALTRGERRDRSQVVGLEGVA